MGIKHEPQPPLEIFRFEGVIDQEAALDFERDFRWQQSLGATRFLVDLEKASYLSSTCLAVLSRISRELADAGGVLVVARSPEKVLRLFRTVGLDHFLHLFPGGEEAVAFGRGTPGAQAGTSGGGPAAGPQAGGETPGPRTGDSPGGAPG